MELEKEQKEKEAVKSRLQELKDKEPSGEITKVIKALEKRLEVLEKRMEGSATVLANLSLNEGKPPKPAPPVGEGKSFFEGIL